MRLETAIAHLIDNVLLAEKNEDIRDKVAWALYVTWKEADRANYDAELEKADCSIVQLGDEHCEECGQTDCPWK